MHQVTDLIGIFDQDVFALWHLHAEIGDSSDNAPPVSQRDVELCREIGGAHRRRAQDYMAGVVSWVRA